MVDLCSFEVFSASLCAGINYPDCDILSTSMIILRLGYDLFL
jgi:hypothetical protein